jgi:adenosylcobinamide-phosphate synthase
MLSNVIITVLAYVIDRIFGEFPFMKHPVSYMGDLISFFEKKYYKDSVFRGLLLVLFVLGVVFVFAYSISDYLSILSPLIAIPVSGVIASVFIAHHMLRDAVLGVVEAEDKKKAISMLVSRDTQDLSESEIYKAAIETYAENLSDGVVAPIFYLLLFGLPGIILYKAINTMDSMVGYRNKRYEKFGKVAAKLDDVANYIPSRITAVLIMLFGKQKDILSFYEDGKKHASPNAGHPITAMAKVLHVSLGGDTSYFGKVQKKASFGQGRKEIVKEDVKRALDVM